MIFSGDGVKGGCACVTPFLQDLKAQPLWGVKPCDGLAALDWQVVCVCACGGCLHGRCTARLGISHDDGHDTVMYIYVHDAPKGDPHHHHRKRTGAGHGFGVSTFTTRWLIGREAWLRFGTDSSARVSKACQMLKSLEDRSRKRPCSSKIKLWGEGLDTAGCPTKAESF